jgi:hypothetical protein
MIAHIGHTMGKPLAHEVGEGFRSWTVTAAATDDAARRTRRASDGPVGRQEASESAVRPRVTLGSTGMPGPMDVVKVTFLR